MSGNSQSTPPRKPQLVLLAEWAAEAFREAPTVWTLRRMVRDGKIVPRPVKVGKAYYVREDAQVVDPNRRLTLVERLMLEDLARVHNPPTFTPNGAALEALQRQRQARKPAKSRHRPDSAT